MRNPDFSERTYTAEVIRCRNDGGKAFQTLLKLIRDSQVEDQVKELTQAKVKICHGYVPSERRYHRLERTIALASGKNVIIPRRAKIRGRDINLYDAYVGYCGPHIVVAVPFHELAEEFFPRIDEELGGMGIAYERLDITEIVIKLGSSGATNVISPSVKHRIELSVTRCHLSYTDQEARTQNINQIRMTGANLGAASQYRALIAPVLRPGDFSLTVTPVVMGFALSSNGVRKSSAVTDRHGNFKLWIAPGLRRLIRLFDLLDVLEAMKGVTVTTSNVPILQSAAIRDAEN